MSRRKRELHTSLSQARVGNAEILGWEVSGEWRGVCYPQADLESLVQSKAPELVDLVPSVHEAPRTFSWAQRRVGTSKDVKFKTVKKNNGYITVVPYVVQSHLKNSAQIEHDRSVKAVPLPAIALKRDSETIVAEDPSDVIAGNISAEFKHLADKVDTEDIRLFVSWVVRKLHGVKMKETGSDWFVPFSPEAEKLLPALQEIVQSVGDDCDLYIPALPKADPNWQRKSANGARNSFNAEYRTILSEVENFVHRLFDGDLLQTAAIKQRLERSKFLRGRIDHYREILELRAENLSSALDLTEEATELLFEGAGEYRFAMKEADKANDDTAKKAAKASLDQFTKKAESLLSKAAEIFPQETTA